MGPRVRPLRHARRRLRPPPGARCAFLKLDCEGAEWGIARHAESLSRVDALALELHLPASRHGEGVGALQQEFGALLTRRAHVPATVLSSTVWMQDR